MTEKDYNPEQRNAKAMEKQMKASKKTVGTPKAEKKAIEVTEEKIEDKKESTEKVIESKEEKKPKKAEPKIVKSEAVVNATGLPISTKTSAAVCKFIKNKKIETAISDLEQVIAKRKAVPMKGEIPHRKGKIMSGRFPKNTSMHFITLLKSLAANSTVNGINNPVVKLAIANIAQRPYSKFGAVRKKRTHVKLVAVELKTKQEKK